MMNRLNEKQEELLQLLQCIPPDLRKIEEKISSCNFTEEDISLVGAVFAQECNGGSRLTEKGTFETVEPNSPYIYSIVELLLKYGLNANAIFAGNLNIMEALFFIETDYIAADTLRLLLEHGGNANLEIDGEGLFDSIDFDIIFGSIEQMNRRRYDAAVHYWFVLLGYGGRPSDGSSPVEVYANYDDQLVEQTMFEIEKLRNHEDYTFGLSHVESKGEPWSLHIFDKKTMWEVARL